MSTIVYNILMKTIEYYVADNGRVPVDEWLNSLDKSIKARILTRLIRIKDDNFGDYKRFEDLIELRFSFGSGYRIYCHEVGNTLVLLLNAGDKKQQSKDIKLAKEYLADWKGKNYV